MTGERDPPNHGDDAHAETPNTPDDGASPAPREYTVGYAKPPKSTRFKPGKSGNPKGRRKGEPSVSEQIRALLRQKVAVTEGGKRKLLSRAGGDVQIDRQEGGWWRSQSRGLPP